MVPEERRRNKSGRLKLLPGQTERGKNTKPDSTATNTNLANLPSSSEQLFHFSFTTPRGLKQTAYCFMHLFS